MRLKRKRPAVHRRNGGSGSVEPHRLSLIGPGEAVELVRINAGRRLTHRLSEMGLTPGVRMLVIQNSQGPVLLSVRGARIALGHGTTEKILVLQIN